jgi:hypothetical protein
VAGNSSVLEAVFFAKEQVQYHCNSQYISWEGVGGPNKYYFYEGRYTTDLYKMLIRENLPEGCE